jgi:hypothetical protein
MKYLAVVALIGGLVGNVAASTWYVAVNGEWQRVAVVPIGDGLYKLNVLGPTIYVEDGTVFNRLSIAGGSVFYGGDTGDFRCGDTQTIGGFDITCK